MAEKLTIPKGEGTDEERLAALDKIAEACFLQGNYHLATRKWTQAGMKQKAMKALLKSGHRWKQDFRILFIKYSSTLGWETSINCQLLWDKIQYQTWKLC